MIKLQIIGNLGNDCEVRDANGMKAITFSVAHTEKYKDKQGVEHKKTTWVRCTIWRTPDKARIAEYLKKGQLVYCEGSPSVNAYADKQTNSPAASLEMRVDDLQLLGGQDKGEGKAPESKQAPATKQPEPDFDDDPLMF